MKYCTYCGAEIMEEAVICVHCGCEVRSIRTADKQKDDTMEIVIKVFLILSCVGMGWMVIPLVWCIPITVTIFKRFKNNEPISTGLKVCTLLLVNMVAGICLLCMDD